MEELIKEYQEKVCSTCQQENCSKRIVLVEGRKERAVKCVDYMKNKNKLKGYVAPLYKTAKEQRCIMLGLARSSK